MDILLWLIRLVHLALVVIVFISVFVSNCTIKEISLIILVFLLVKYIIGVDKCILTQIEYRIMGEKNYQKGFIYRFMNPISKLSETYFNYGLFVLNIIWIGVLIYQLRKLGCDFSSLI